jgi:hypothetical protein
VRVVANNLASVHSVGLQVVSATFDEYTRAVTSGYHFDSTLVAPVGATIAVNSLDVSTCSLYSLGSSYYAKFIVDSVNAAQKAFYVRLLADPNCGYRTLTGGVPNN